jgi:hypothetical protein
MRIFRTLVLLTGLAVFLPSPPDDASAGKATEAQAASSGLIGSATLAIVDMAGFCGRQPTVCQTAGFVAGRLEAKAKYNVKLLYEWANGPGGGDAAPPMPESAEAVPSDPLKTGATTAFTPTRVAAGQSTLRIEDLIPEWRGPASKAKG